MPRNSFHKLVYSAERYVQCWPTVSHVFTLVFPPHNVLQVAVCAEHHAVLVLEDTELASIEQHAELDCATTSVNKARRHSPKPRLLKNDMDSQSLQQCGQQALLLTKILKRLLAATFLELAGLVASKRSRSHPNRVYGW